jgi:hypothetical protein
MKAAFIFRGLTAALVEVLLDQFAAILLPWHLAILVAA